MDNMAVKGGGGMSWIPKSKSEGPREKQLSEGWGKQWKEPPVGSGMRGRTPAGSLLGRGSDFATTTDPPTGECC